MRILIVPNYSRSDALADAYGLEEWLLSKDLQVGWAPDMYEQQGQMEDISDYSLVVSLGGDGTLLRAVRLVGDSGVPVVGISYGHLGFLTCAGPEDLIKTVDDALQGKLHASKRATLDICARFRREDNSVVEVHKTALNDLALGHGDLGDVITIEVSVSGNHIDKLRGDGFVVSTATGSTGYALAAGGPIVTPEFEGMVCVPVAPHTIMARAFLTGREDVVTITVDREKHASVCVYADGRPMGTQWELESVSCRKGARNVVLLNRSRESFYGSVSRVFYGKAAQR